MEENRGNIRKVIFRFFLCGITVTERSVVFIEKNVTRRIRAIIPRNLLFRQVGENNCISFSLLLAISKEFLLGVKKFWIATIFIQGTRSKSAVHERRLRMSMDVWAWRRLSLIPCSPSSWETAKKASRDQKRTALCGAFCTWTMICNRARVYTCNQRYVPRRVAETSRDFVRKFRSGIFYVSGFAQYSKHR